MELYQIKTEHPVVGYCESRIGGRSENQDSYGYHDTPFGLLVVVCDGMGGGPAGKTASSLAVSEILAGVMESEADTTPMDVLQKAIQRANRALLDAVADNPDLSGMGTTCTALLLNEQSAIMAHVGDSRIYQLRRHGKVFRTFDHSLVFDLVKQKVITEEQARLSDQSNIITRALGMKPELEIDIEERPYKKGDRFLLCTDGIHGTMPEKELIALATQRGDLGKVVDGIAAMVDENGRKNGNGYDNLTLTLIETKEKSKLKEKMKNKTTLILGLIAAALGIVCLLLNSCQNEDIDVDTFSIESEDVRPGVDSVRIEGTYDFFGDAEAMKLNIGRDSTLSDAQSHAVVLTGKDYAVTVRNLQPSTTYYYRYSVNIGLPRDFLTPTKHFTTLQVQNYTVSVIAIPNESGTVNGGGTYQQGQQCTVSATANEGYAFVNWTENDTVVALDSLYTFIVNANHTLVAHFEPLAPDEYTINVSAHPSNGGAVSGGGTFQEGQSCTVRATANTGYTFVNWTENGNQVSSDANYTFTVNGDRYLVANFTAASYIISATVTPNGSGTITGAGGYEYGQSCTLKATANSGHTFEKWTENGTQVSTNATYTFTVSESRSLVAHFKVNSYIISVSANPSAGGVATGGGTFEYGQSCSLSATANSGYNFSNWTEGGNVVSSNSNYTFTVTGNRTLKANFTQQAPQNYSISVSANPSDGGTVTGGGTYQQGQSCTVRAVANSGYTFSKWTKNGDQVSTDANYTFTVAGNRTLVAHFTANPQNYTITVSANPSNGGTVNGGGNYQQGQSCTVTATPNSGYSFTNWTENGSVVSSNASYTFMVNGSRTLVANFTYDGGGVTPDPDPDPSGNATIVLSYPVDIWGDGGGYQMLLDADATACGVDFQESGGYGPTDYSNFEYLIPENAAWPANSGNIVGAGSSASIEIPAGTYDWVIVNPYPAGGIQYITAPNGNVGGRQNDYVFEGGKVYTFTISTYGPNDGCDVVISGSNGAMAYANCVLGMTYPGGYLTFDIDAPANVTRLGTATVNRGGDYADGFFYGYNSDGVFYKINIETGAVVEQHSTSGQLTEMAYNYANSTMYGIDNSTSGNSQLVTVDLATGAKTVVGSLGVSIMAFAIDLQGNAYGISITDGNFYSINLAAATLTQLGSTGKSVSYVQCMNFDHNTETLYWFQISSDTDCALYTVNTANGACTLLMNQPGEVTSFFVPYEGAKPVNRLLKSNKESRKYPGRSTKAFVPQSRIGLSSRKIH